MAWSIFANENRGQRKTGGPELSFLLDDGDDDDDDDGPFFPVDAQMSMLPMLSCYHPTNKPN